MMNKLFRKIAVVTCGVAMMFPFAMIHAEENEPNNTDTYKVQNVIPTIGEYMPGTVITDVTTNVKNYVYCIDARSAWPDNNLIYAKKVIDGSDQVLTSTVQAQIKRTIYAGYPQDALGFSKLTNEASLTKGMYTQYVIWAILNDPRAVSYVKNNNSAYIKALYEYAVNETVDGKKPSEIKLSFSEPKFTGLTKNEEGMWEGKISFDSTKQVALTIGEIPTGVRLYSNQIIYNKLAEPTISYLELKKGDTVDTTETVTVVSESAKRSELNFTYSSKETISGDLELFVPTQTPYQFMRTDTTDINDVYQRMVGYKYKESTTPTLLKIGIEEKVDNPTTDDTPVVTPTTDDTPVVTPTTDDTPVVTPTTDDRQVTPTTNEEVTTPATAETVVTPVTTETVERPSTPTTSETPNTGDETNIALFAGLFGFAVIAAGAVVVLKKKYSL